MCEVALILMELQTPPWQWITYLAFESHYKIELGWDYIKVIVQETWGPKYSLILLTWPGGVDSSYHAQTNASLERGKFQALVSIVHIRERYGLL